MMPTSTGGTLSGCNTSRLTAARVRDSQTGHQFGHSETLDQVLEGSSADSIRDLREAFSGRKLCEGTPREYEPRSRRPDPAGFLRPPPFRWPPGLAIRGSIDRPNRVIWRLSCRDRSMEGGRGMPHGTVVVRL